MLVISQERQHRLWILATVAVVTVTIGMFCIHFFAAHKLFDNLPKCNGAFQHPSNSTFYLNKPVDPQTMHNELSNLHNRFRTVIFDCQMSVVSPFSNYSSYNDAFLKALAKFKQVHRSPLNVWLRLDLLEDANANFTFCTDLAALGNKIFPGTVQGVLGNSEILLAYTSGVDDENSIFYYKNNHSPCNWYSEECFELLKGQGLKFGLMLNPQNCQEFPSLVSHSIVRKFDEIFYFDEEESSQKMTIGKDKVPTLTVSNDFNECKHFVAEMVPEAKTVKYVIEEKYKIDLPWKLSPYPYCLKFV